MCPEDPEQPLIVRAIFNGKQPEDSEAYLEIDTVESAREWRREIQGIILHRCYESTGTLILTGFHEGAIFMYKRGLVAALQGVEADTDGVRISIPIQSIETHTLSPYMETLHIVSLSLSAPSETSDDASSLDSDHSIESVEFVVTSLHECKDGLAALAEAKRTVGDPYTATRKIVVDFGSLGFPQPAESEESVASAPRSREQAVCDAIGIGASSHIWSASGFWGFCFKVQY